LRGRRQRALKKRCADDGETAAGASRAPAKLRAARASVAAGYRFRYIFNNNFVAFRIAAIAVPARGVTSLT